MGRVHKSQIQVVAVLGLCVAIICLTIAYSLMSEKLFIDGNTNMNPAVWDIHFSNVSATVVGAATYKLPTINGTNLNEFEVVLTKPGDSVTFAFEIINDGNIDAVLSNINKGMLECSGREENDAKIVCNHLIYKFSRENGEEIEEGTIFYSNKKEIVRVTIEYPMSADVLPTGPVKMDGIVLELNYIQK